MVSCARFENTMRARFPYFRADFAEHVNFEDHECPRHRQWATLHLLWREGQQTIADKTKQLGTLLDFGLDGLILEESRADHEIQVNANFDLGVRSERIKIEPTNPIANRTLLWDLWDEVSKVLSKWLSLHVSWGGLWP